MNRANRRILWLCKVEKTFFFVIDSHLNESAFTSRLKGMQSYQLNRYVKGVRCVNRRYTKGVLFFVKNGI